MGRDALVGFAAGLATAAALVLLRRALLLRRATPPEAPEPRLADAKPRVSIIAPEEARDKPKRRAPTLQRQRSSLLSAAKSMGAIGREEAPLPPPILSVSSPILGATSPSPFADAAADGLQSPYAHKDLERRFFEPPRQTRELVEAAPASRPWEAARQLWLLDAARTTGEKPKVHNRICICIYICIYMYMYVCICIYRREAKGVHDHAHGSPTLTLTKTRERA